MAADVAESQGHLDRVTQSTIKGKPMNRDDILKRAAKFASITEAAGASQAEAEQAARRLGELLRENNLSMGDVTAAQMEADIERQDVRSGFQRPPGWATHLACGIAHACDCRLLTLSAFVQFSADGKLEQSPHRFAFVGHSADVAVASYFLGYLLQLLPDMAKRARPYDRKAWLIGACIAITRRLREAIHPIGDDTKQSALIVVKDAAITSWMSRAIPKLGKAKPLPSIPENNPSMTAGYLAGQRVPLNHAIAASTTSTAPRIGTAG